MWTVTKKDKNPNAKTENDSAKPYLNATMAITGNIMLITSTSELGIKEYKYTEKKENKAKRLSFIVFFNILFFDITLSLKLSNSSKTKDIR